MPGRPENFAKLCLLIVAILQKWDPARKDRTLNLLTRANILPTFAQIRSGQKITQTMQCAGVPCFVLFFARILKTSPCYVAA